MSQKKSLVVVSGATGTYANFYVYSSLNIVYVTNANHVKLTLRLLNQVLKVDRLLVHFLLQDITELGD